MAENETLDISGPSGRKWREIIEGVYGGIDRDVIASLAVSAFRFNFRKFLRASEAKGVTLAALLNARTSQQELRRLFAASGKIDGIRIFMETARAEERSDAEGVLSAFLENLMDRIEDQIVQDLSTPEPRRGVEDLARIVRGIRVAISEDIEAMAHRLNDDPSWKPRKKPARSMSPPDSTDQLLGVSLLKAARP